MIIYFANVAFLACKAQCSVHLWDECPTLYDQRDTNGTELRAVSGNFLFSTGANEFARRFTKGHFDLPMMNCTISLDDEIVVDQGRVVPDKPAV